MNGRQSDRPIMNKTNKKSLRQKEIKSNNNGFRDETAVKFGTDGFRGIISKDFTYRTLKIVALAICDYIHSKKLDLKTAVFYDRRFMSDIFAGQMAKIFAENSISVDISSAPVPTPALSYYVKSSAISLGVMITASHNPYEYNGIKIKTSDGTSASPEIVLEVQKRIDSIIADGFDEQIFKKKYGVKKTGIIKSIDATDAYLANIAAALDIKLLKKLKGRFLINPMHGSQAGLFKRFKDKFKLAAECGEIFSGHNPLFPGFNPEPIAPNLVQMSEYMKKKGAAEKYDAGFCFDGDGDRIGAMTSDGIFVSPQLIFALLLNHLAKNKKRRGGVAKTVSVTALVSAIAAKHGIEVFETPIGFKYIAGLITDKSKKIMIGGEESGGIGLDTYLPERDGLFLALSLLEVIAFEKKPLHRLIEDLFKDYGRFIYDRIDFKFDDFKFNEIKEKLEKKRLAEICGFKVENFSKTDGHKYFLSDGSWILFRFSGTEPVLRIYAEAPVKVKKDENKVKELLKFARDYFQI